MKLLTRTLLTLSLFSTYSFAAPSGFYIEVGGGLGLSDTIETTDKLYVYDQGYLASAILGYQANKFRFEFEQRYKSDNLYSQSIDNTYHIKVDGKLITNSQMFNISYSGYNQSNLIATVGMGAGVSCIDLEDITTEDKVLSAQAIFGLGYKISEYFISTLRYSYFYTSKSDNFKAKGDNTLALSLRYIF